MFHKHCLCVQAYANARLLPLSLSLSLSLFLSLCCYIFISRNVNTRIGRGKMRSLPLDEAHKLQTINEKKFIFDPFFIFDPPALPSLQLWNEYEKKSNAR